MALWVLGTSTIKVIVTLLFAAATTRATDNRNVFNPRMDYDEWKPLGRGDPLKNDPTYDYVPPVLDHVYYWIDPNKRTPDPPLPSSETRTESASNLQASSRLDTMGLLDPFFKVIDASKAALGLGPDLVYRPSTSNIMGYAPLQKAPEVQLMPPPPPPPPLSPRPISTMISSFSPTTPTTATAAAAAAVGPTRSTSEQHLNSTSTSKPLTQVTQSLANTDNFYKPVAINMPNKTYDEVTTELSNLVAQKTSSMRMPSVEMMPPSLENGYSFQLTTTQRTFTTDSMFKHYKQPAQPLNGPFYLIIQGHSKVKTYGAGKTRPIIHPITSNELRLDDTQSNEVEENLKNGRKGKKLPEDSDIVEGYPLIELSASFESRSPRVGGDPKDNKYKQFVVVGNEDDTEETKTSLKLGRKLLQATENTEASTLSSVDKQQLYVESLIALNDDYREEDVINLLLKEEGQGSGLGAYVASLLSRATKDEV